MLQFRRADGLGLGLEPGLGLASGLGEGLDLGDGLGSGGTGLGPGVGVCTILKGLGAPTPPELLPRAATPEAITAATMLDMIKIRTLTWLMNIPPYSLVDRESIESLVENST